MNTQHQTAIIVDRLLWLLDNQGPKALHEAMTLIGVPSIEAALQDAILARGVATTFSPRR